MVAAREQARHRWLEALGIDSWLPRRDLPTAAKAAPWVASFRYEPVTPADGGMGKATEPAPPQRVKAAAPTPRPPRPEPVARAKIDTATLLEQPPATPAVTLPDPPARPAATAVEEAPRFKLAFLWRQDLLIVDSLPPHHPQGFSRYHHTLLSGITAALGAGADTALSDVSMLSWPTLTSRTLDQGAEEARQAVQHKLRRTLAAHPGLERVLLMGEAAAHWILAETAPLETLRGRRFTLPTGQPVVVTLSLSELLRLPERKAETWRDIQPLRRVPG
jgi:hypothetical protein